MGWMTTYRRKGITNLEWYQDRFGPTHKILAISQVRGGPVYMAVQHIGGSMDGFVYGLVSLTQWTRGDYNFGSKEIDESCGPNEDNCPERIMRLLTPLDDSHGPDSYARGWRARCWANIEAKKARPKVREGDRVRFLEPMRFTDGRTLDTFTYEKGSTFIDHSSGYSRRYRLRKWRERPYEVVA